MALPKYLALISGFPGYELWDQPQVTGLKRGTKYWIQEPRVLGPGFIKMALSADGVSPYPDVGVRLYPGGSPYSYYQILWEYFTGLGYTMLNPRLDWRLEAGLAAVELRRWIDYWVGLNQDRPIRFICHSGGAIFLRWALWDKDNAYANDRIRAVVTLSGAHYGGYDMVAALNGQINIGTFTWPAGFGNVSTLFFQPLRGLNNYLNTAQSFPGAYYLIPPPNAPGMTAAVSNKLWDPNAYLQGSDNSVTRWLPNGKAQWANLPTTPVGPQWLAITSTGIPTCTGISVNGNLSSALTYVRTKDGDGTVPVAHQSTPGMATAQFSGLDHGQICQNLAVLGRAAQWFDAH